MRDDAILEYNDENIALWLAWFTARINLCLTRTILLVCERSHAVLVQISVVVCRLLYSRLKVRQISFFIAEIVFVCLSVRVTKT